MIFLIIVNKNKYFAITNLNWPSPCVSRDRGQTAYFRENLRTHVAPTKFYDNKPHDTLITKILSILPKIQDFHH